MRKFASLVISGSMVSSVIMQLRNHASSLDSYIKQSPTRYGVRSTVSLSNVTLKARMRHPVPDRGSSLLVRYLVTLVLLPLGLSGPC